MKENKAISLITISIVGVIFLYIIVFLGLLIGVGYSNLTIETVTNLSIVALILIILINLFIIVPIILMIKSIIRKVKKESMSEIDFKKYEGYYREILSKYSPAEIEYVDNFKCNIKNTIIATLLKLELIGKIKINEDKIEVIDSNINELTQTEKYVFNSIKDGSVHLSALVNIQVYTCQEAEKDGLIKRFKLTKEELIKKIIKGIAILVGAHLFFELQDKNMELINSVQNMVLRAILCIPFISIGVYFFLLPVKILGYLMMKLSSYVRTEEGEELNKKIEGLKNYITKYSTIETREKEELVIWEDYLIYSVIFEINKKIVEDMSRLVKN